MKIIFRLLIPATVLAFTACSEGDTNSGSTEAAQNNIPTQNNIPITSPAPVTIQNTDTARNMSVASNPQTVALNPAHGEPGHRCDISVGAPLNSAPTAQSPQPVQTVTPPPTTIPAPAPVTAPAPTTTAAGTNPPHGEPGHDCSIAVGAPLKKK